MFWRAFRDKPDYHEPKYCVVDDAGTFEIDKKYRDLGVKEGWLVRTGYTYNKYNQMMFVYRHIKRKRVE